MEEYTDNYLYEYSEDDMEDDDLYEETVPDRYPEIDGSVFPDPKEEIKGQKECKIIHINDGREIILLNDNRLYVEEWTASEQIIQKYLDAGYEVKKLIPDVTPAIQKEGCYSFYKTGITVYFERKL